jgi:hypothetical protein
LLDGDAFAHFPQFFLNHRHVGIAVVAHVELAALVIWVEHAYFNHLLPPVVVRRFALRGSWELIVFADIPSK